MIALVLIASCGKSKEKEKKAKDLYESVLLSVSDIVAADSLYAKCLQYLMREMQKPMLKRDKVARKILEDSAQSLIVRYDNLCLSIDSSCARMDTMQLFDEELDIIAPAQKVCEAYRQISTKEYKDICDNISSFSFPVNDAQFTDILSLTYSADSLLNDEVASLNEKMKQFAEKYNLISEEE